jgi:hypothetical protein
MYLIPIGDPYPPYTNRNYRWKNDESAPPMLHIILHILYGHFIFIGILYLSCSTKKKTKKKTNKGENKYCP